MKEPMEVKASTVRGAMVVVEGATTIEAMAAGVTSRVAVPFTEFRVAVMVVDPGATETARPVAMPMVAAAVFDEDHAACIVMLCLLPSL